MNFQGNECPVCHHPFGGEDDIVVCPYCGTPHHRECWQQEGHCANEAQHSSGYEWKNSHPEATEKPEKANIPPKTQEKSDVVVCPECGTENRRSNPSCVSCGAPLSAKGTLGGVFGLDINGLDSRVAPPGVMIDGIPAEETAAYIGPSANRYIFHFINMEKRNAKSNWNLSAALFRPLWCFYRKMYGIGFAFLLLEIIVTVITLPHGFGAFCQQVIQHWPEIMAMQEPIEYLAQNMPVISAWQNILYSVFSFASMLLFGLFGDTLYRRKVKKSILQCRPQASSMPEYMALLRKKGGVSILMVLVYLFLLRIAQNTVIIGLVYLLQI